jgi:hypothetical protein
MNYAAVVGAADIADVGVEEFVGPQSGEEGGEDERTVAFGPIVSLTRGLRVDVDGRYQVGHNLALAQRFLVRLDSDWAAEAMVVDSGRESLVSSASGLLLKQTLRCSGLEQTMSAALAPWRFERAVHDQAKVLTDLALAVARSTPRTPCRRRHGHQFGHPI